MNHTYGRDGREYKKIDTKSTIFDVEIFQELTHKNIVDQIKNSITMFIEAINNNHNYGKNNFCL